MTNWKNAVSFSVAKVPSMQANANTDGSITTPYLER
jgi:hypothetical protein